MRAAYLITEEKGGADSIKTIERSTIETVRKDIDGAPMDRADYRFLKDALKDIGARLKKDADAQNTIVIGGWTYTDEMYATQRANPGYIYSHMTALYLHELSRYIPTRYEMTTSSPQQRPTGEINQYQIFHTEPRYKDLGTTKVLTVFGNAVDVHNETRATHHAIQDIERLLAEDVYDATGEYLRTTAYGEKHLMRYAEIFGNEKHTKHHLRIAKSYARS
jgi:hypothetical protein